MMESRGLFVPNENLGSKIKLQILRFNQKYVDLILRLNLVKMNLIIMMFGKQVSYMKR